MGREAQVSEAERQQQANNVFYCYYTADDILQENIDRSVIYVTPIYSIEDCAPLTREFLITTTHTLQPKIIYCIIIMMPIVYAPIKLYDLF